MKTIFRVVHDKEVRDFFSRLGLLDDLDSGLIVCANCRRVLTDENFRAVGRVDNELVFLCDQTGCQAFFPEPLSDAEAAQ